MKIKHSSHCAPHMMGKDCEVSDYLLWSLAFAKKCMSFLLIPCRPILSVPAGENLAHHGINETFHFREIVMIAIRRSARQFLFDVHREPLLIVQSV